MCRGIHSSWWSLQGQKTELTEYYKVYTLFSVTKSSPHWSRLGLSHWDPYAMHRGDCLELYYCNMVEWSWWDSSLIWKTKWFLQCFDTVGLVVWPVKIVPEMTYNVSSGTLSLYTTTTAECTTGRWLDGCPFASKMHLALLWLWPWPLTTRTLSALPTHMMNICAKFHWSPSNNWREIASRNMGVDRWPVGRPENVNAVCLLLSVEA